MENTWRPLSLQPTHMVSTRVKFEYVCHCFVSSFPIITKQSRSSYKQIIEKPFDKLFTENKMYSLGSFQPFLSLEVLYSTSSRLVENQNDLSSSQICNRNLLIECHFTILSNRQTIKVISDVTFKCHTHSSCTFSFLMT